MTVLVVQEVHGGRETGGATMMRERQRAREGWGGHGMEECGCGGQPSPSADPAGERDENTTVSKIAVIMEGVNVCANPHVAHPRKRVNDG
jgi:hypothetical protein